MNTFNLMISSNRNYEQFAEREIWFVLMIAGDSSPVIMHSPIPGILLVNTSLNPYKVIQKMRGIMKKEPNFFQFVLRVIPVDQVVETDLDLIYQKSLQLYRSKKRLTRKRKSFAVQIKKRATPMSRNEIIDKIVPHIPNKVDLKNPDWVLHCEIIGNVTGISVMKPTQILRIISERNIILQSN
ncbi:MAG: THUMP domain-containing protein [Promethearchaeota archaeon]